METKKCVSRSYFEVAFAIFFPATYASFIEASPVLEFEKAFKRDPVCW